MDEYSFLELFGWCARGELELQQAVCKSMRRMITARSNELPLRTINKVVLDPVVDKIEIYLIKPNLFETEPDFETSLTDGDFEGAFRRLQHCRIENFALDIVDSRFMRYWKAQETDFSVEHIEHLDLDDVDYEALDAAVSHLRPKHYRLTVSRLSWNDGWNSEQVKLIARDPFLSSLRMCSLDILESGLPPLAFILEEPGYPNYEFKCAGWKAADWIDSFIESFDRDGCANTKLESVCVRWDAYGYRQFPEPTQLNEPTKSDVPLPKTEMVMHLVPSDYRVTQCEVQTFANTEQWKRMEVHKWCIQYWGSSSRVATHVLLISLKNGLN